MPYRTEHSNVLPIASRASSLLSSMDRPRCAVARFWQHQHTALSHKGAFGGCLSQLTPAHHPFQRLWSVLQLRRSNCCFFPLSTSRYTPSFAHVATGSVLVRKSSGGIFAGVPVRKCKNEELSRQNTVVCGSVTYMAVFAKCLHVYTSAAHWLAVFAEDHKGIS